MKHYLEEIKEIIDISRQDVDGILVVNKDGYVEYYKPCEPRFNVEMADFGKAEIGRHVLDLYPELNEQNSTVMETLRTGKTIVGKKQSFTWNGSIITMVSVTYPILENGTVQGAIDAAKILDVRKEDEAGLMDQLLYCVEDIITQDPEMQRLKDTIRKVAQSESPALIYGETGTGKELVAESLHTMGPRRGKPFFSQNCAAIPSNLLESIFFGTEKGGFTGAESRKGIFELADGGTLFLDELNSMDLSMQAKLLKAIEDKKVRRIGGKEDICFDVRIVCAMNENPEHMMEQGALRADLYYRIGVIRLEIPPLRRRPGDVELLTDYYIREYNRRMNRNISGLSQMTKQLFLKWHWPGNIRELKNTVESAFNVEQSEWITISSVQDLLRRAENSEMQPGHDLGNNPAQGEYVQYPYPGNAAENYSEFRLEESLEHALQSERFDLKEALNRYERCILQAALRREGQMNKAARKLGMSPQKLQYRMEKLGLREKSRKIDL